MKKNCQNLTKHASRKILNEANQKFQKVLRRQGLS